MIPRRAATIAAPAKINLGLEILGKRDDGYHEIRTVMAMIRLADSLTISTRGEGASLTIDGVPGVSDDDNLIAKAVKAFTKETGAVSGYEVTVDKRIPSPGGLGGASSDAAATLIALNAIHDQPLSVEALTRLSATLGADVPFFLGSPIALARGTGTTLSPLPAIDGWLVLVVPRLDVTAKTPTLYAALRPNDFSDGSRADRVAECIQIGNLPPTPLLTNAFERPLYEMAPSLRTIRQHILNAGAPYVSLSGAGPAHYVLFEAETDALALAAKLDGSLPKDTLVLVTRLAGEKPAVDVETL